eukprot:528438-Rhodomonas_salina.1
MMCVGLVALQIVGGMQGVSGATHVAESAGATAFDGLGAKDAMEEADPAMDGARSRSACCRALLNAEFHDGPASA